MKFALPIAIVALLGVDSVRASSKNKPNHLHKTNGATTTGRGKPVSLQLPRSFGAINTQTTVPRGGGRVANTLPNAVAGTVAFALIEQAVKACFKAANFSYPAALGACILLFAFLCLADVVAPTVASTIFDSLTPGAALLAKWFPIFFVPGLALLPLSPPIGGAVDIFKIVLTVAVGFVYSLATTLGGVVAVRRLQGREAATTSKPSGGSPTKNKGGSPFSDEQWTFFWKASIALGLASVTATKLEVTPLVSLLQMLFTLTVTVGSFIGATRLPSGFIKIVHPLVTSSIIVLASIRGLAAVTGQDFLHVLRTYKAGSLIPTKAGAGDYLLYILGPSVVSFAVSVYSRKDVLFRNLPMVLTAMLVSSAGGLFATGAFVRVLELGGKTGNAALVRLSVLARNVTTALAMALTQMVGGDLAIVSAVVCLTGILGASYGIPLLNALGVKDPICRGLGIGSSSQGLGVAAMAVEPDAFPFASVAMVLTAVCATTLTSIPSVREALIKTTIGSLPAPA